jgi:Asp-tRNA(Asn)/Glu-tRNA(Gln) amidotransferase A subunit family amidase
MQAPDAVSLLAELRRGLLTSEQLVSERLARLVQSQPAINGATQIFVEAALAQAAQLTATATGRCLYSACRAA